MFLPKIKRLSKVSGNLKMKLKFKVQNDPSHLAHTCYGFRMIDRLLYLGDHEFPKSGKIKSSCQSLSPKPEYLEVRETCAQKKKVGTVVKEVNFYFFLELRQLHLMC